MLYYLYLLHISICFEFAAKLQHLFQTAKFIFLRAGILSTHLQVSRGLYVGTLLYLCSRKKKGIKICISLNLFTVIPIGPPGRLSKLPKVAHTTAASSALCIARCLSVCSPWNGLRRTFASCKSSHPTPRPSSCSVPTPWP